MPKIGRVAGSSVGGQTRQAAPVYLPGTDLQLTGTDSDLVINGNLVVARELVASARVELMEHQPAVYRWRQMLARARQGGLSATILIIADSLARFGATRYRNAWPDRLRRRFQGATPGSLGLLPASEGLASVLDADWPGGDNPWTYTGAVTANIDYGLGLHSANVPAAGTATITYFGDKISLFYVRTPTGPTAATVTLDGTSVGPLNANGALAAGQGVTYGTHGAFGHHTLVVTPNDGTLIIEGVSWFDADAPFFINGSVQIYDASHGGFSTTFWAGTNNDWSASIASADSFVGCVVIELGANDITLGVTVQQFEDNLVTIANRVDARLGSTLCSYLLVVMPGITHQAYIDAYYKAARRIGPTRAGVLDLGALRPDRLFGGDLSSDASHPNDAGHIWIAEALGQVLDPTPTTLQPTAPTQFVIEAGTPAAFRSSWTDGWAAVAGEPFGYDEAATGATVRERRHRVWLDPGTYRATATFQHATGHGTGEILIGRWAGNTPTLTSCGTVDTSTPAGPAFTTTRLGTSVTTDVAGWVPVVIRKTSVNAPVRFVRLLIDKTA